MALSLGGEEPGSETDQGGSIPRHSGCNEKRGCLICRSALGNDPEVRFPEHGRVEPQAACCHRRQAAPDPPLHGVRSGQQRDRRGRPSARPAGRGMADGRPMAVTFTVTPIPKQPIDLGDLLVSARAPISSLTWPAVANRLSRRPWPSHIACSLVASQPLVQPIRRLKHSVGNVNRWLIQHFCL